MPTTRRAREEDDDDDEAQAQAQAPAPAPEDYKAKIQKLANEFVDALRGAPGAILNAFNQIISEDGGGPDSAFTYDPDGHLGDVRGTNTHAAEQSEGKERINNGEGPWRPLNALFKQGVSPERDEAGNRWLAGSRLDVAIWPVEPGAKWPDLANGTINTSKYTYHSQLMFWDRRPCGLVKDYRQDTSDNLRNSEYHVVHEALPKIKSPPEAGSANRLFQSRFARRRYILNSADPSFRVAWWQRWTTRAPAGSVRDKERAEPTVVHVPPYYKEAKPNPRPFKDNERSDPYENHSAMQGTGWARRQIPDATNNYAPRWELSHLVFYQLNFNNYAEPASTTKRGVQRHMNLTADARHPLRRFFDEMGNAHERTRAYAQHRLRYKGPKSNAHAPIETRRCFAECDVTATWGLMCEREKAHLVWWSRDGDRWESTCIWAETISATLAKDNSKEMVAYTLAKPSLSIKIQGKVLRRRLARYATEASPEANEDDRATKRKDEQSADPACRKWSDYTLTQMEKALEPEEYVLAFTTSDNGQTWTCTINRSACAIFRNPGALSEGISPGMALDLGWPAGTGSVQCGRNVIWWNDAFSSALKNEIRISRDVLAPPPVTRLPQNWRSMYLDPGAPYFNDLPMFDTINGPARSAAASRRTNGQGIGDDPPLPRAAARPDPVVAEAAAAAAAAAAEAGEAGEAGAPAPPELGKRRREERPAPRPPPPPGDDPMRQAPEPRRTGEAGPPEEDDTIRGQVDGPERRRNRAVLSQGLMYYNCYGMDPDDFFEAMTPNRDQEGARLDASGVGVWYRGRYYKQGNLEGPEAANVLDTWDDVDEEIAAAPYEFDRWCREGDNSAISEYPESAPLGWLSAQETLCE